MPDIENHSLTGEELIVSIFEVAPMIAPTLERFDLSTIGQLASLDIYDLSKQRGIGVRKLDLIQRLVQQAKSKLSKGEPSADFANADASFGLTATPLLFVPTLLAKTFERYEIATVQKVLSLRPETLSGREGWGDKKLDLVVAMQKLYSRLNGGTPGPDELLGDFVDQCLLANEQFSLMPVSVLISEEFSGDAFKGKARTQIEQLRRLFSSHILGTPTGPGAALSYFGTSELGALEWRDVPLAVNKRVIAFLDRLNLSRITDLDYVATTGFVLDAESNERVHVCRLEKSNENSLRNLRSELEKLARKGLTAYRNGVICNLEQLPADLPWRDIPLSIPAELGKFLDTQKLTTTKDVHRLAVRAQIKARKTGQWVDAISHKNFSESSLATLRKELNRLAIQGLDNYRYGDAGAPQNAVALLAFVSDALSVREFRALQLRASDVSGEETAAEFRVSRETVRHIETDALDKCRRFRIDAVRVLASMDNLLCLHPSISLAVALSETGTNDLWQVMCIGRIAGREYFRLKNGTLSRFSPRTLDALDELLRDVASSGSFNFPREQISIRELLQKCTDPDKWFVTKLTEHLRGADETISRQFLTELIGTDWLRAHVRSQLVSSKVNGLFFDEIDVCAFVESAEALAEIMGDDARVLADGRFLRPGQAYRRVDEIKEIVRRAGGPISIAEIMSRSNEKWHQAHLVGFLSQLYEIIQFGRGQYVHIESLSLTVREVLSIASWGAELLAGERVQVDGVLLFQLYRHSDLPYPLANEYQLVSIIAKHPDVRRATNNLQLAHRTTFDESELHLAVTDPEIAGQWHYKKNRDVTPENVRPTSAKKYWWKCDAGHDFQVSVVYRTRVSAACPLCEGKWTLRKIRHLVRSLRAHIAVLTPAELYVIFQQSGLWQTGGKARGFVKALATGLFPAKELDKFVTGENSLVDEFLDDDELQLIVASASQSDDEQLPATADSATGGSKQGSVDETNTLPEVRTKKVLAALDSLVLASTDAEAAEFLIASAKAKIWNHAYRDESGAVREAKRFRGTVYAQRVRADFLREYSLARDLPIPEGYHFSVDGIIRAPNLMQRRVAAQVRDRKRFGNWSCTGAGKTLSAILATRVTDAYVTVICCPNAVVGDSDTGWATEISRVFPDSRVYTKTFTPDWDEREGSHNYLILNYEQFQQPDSETTLKRFVEATRIDFIVIDEVHFAKQRYADQVSQRKRLVQALVLAAGKANPDLRVLALSATPVINNLQEGRSLVEMITGLEHNDIPVKATVANCMRLHQKLSTLGTRWRPTYESDLSFQTIDVDCSAFLPEIRALGVNHSPLELEKILTRARLPTIIRHLEHNKRTLLYTHYVEDIAPTLSQAISAAGFRVGFYTGEQKGGLEQFKAGELDVLVGSSAIGTGVDGLQHCCHQLIVNVLPWTHAEYEQLIGRLWRQGQAEKTVKVLVPITFAEVKGQRWSYCDSKLDRIKYKKSIADAAVDGAVPEGCLRSPAQAQSDIMAWLARLDEGRETTFTRRLIVVPLSGDESDVRARTARYGDFSNMNRRWNQMRSDALSARLVDNPEEWEQYHTYYREARSKWTVVPVTEMINWCKKREGYVIADFGCGEAQLASAVGNRHTVYSFDHIAINDEVIEGDMSCTPIDNDTLDVAVFSLSLMGSNFGDYLREAHRALKIDGHLHVWEATSRFRDIPGFCRALERLGFRAFPAITKGQFTHIQAQKTDRAPEENTVISF